MPTVTILSFKADISFVNFTVFLSIYSLLWIVVPFKVKVKSIFPWRKSKECIGISLDTVTEPFGTSKWFTRVVSVYSNAVPSSFVIVTLDVNL